MMYIHQDSGLVNISYFKFDVDDTTGELDANRAVSFRLTPNIVEYLSSIGTTGPLTASAIATARCLVQPNFKVSNLSTTVKQLFNSFIYFRIYCYRNFIPLKNIHQNVFIPCSINSCQQF